MRIAYLDCFAGIAGDMFLGALVSAGVPPKVLQDTVASLGIGASLSFETVDRSGISSMKVHVLEESPKNGDPVRSSIVSDHPVLEQDSQQQVTFSHQPKTQHLHKGGHSHGHTHETGTHLHEPGPHDDGDLIAGHHAHGRSLSAIRTLIQSSRLDDVVKAMAIRTFELLGNSEAKVHNVPVEDVHFHEVGAVDAIVDIVAASAGIHHLKIGAWYCSALNVGGGMVDCAHGTFPVPAPATADLLRGIPTYSAHVRKELVTPTGAALVRMLEPTFGAQPPMKVEQIGYGAGTRNPPGFPNVLRLSIGESSDDELKPVHDDRDSVIVIETALDDLSPQVIAYVTEAALARGALDVMLTPVIMKKGRPGTLLTVLCNDSESEVLQRFILSETSTLGVRTRREHRACLDRSHVTVQTGYGEIRVKVGSLDGVELNVAPEFEDCRAAAQQHNVPVKRVQQAAIAAYGR